MPGAPYTGEDVQAVLDDLIDSFGDHKLVTENGEEITFINYEREGGDEDVFVLETEDN